MHNLTRLLTAGCLALCLHAAQAAHSSYSPMSPRALVAEESHKAHSYGLTVLPGNALDNFEPIGRNVAWTVSYNFFDKIIMRPIAHGYAYLPSPIRTGVGNFFGNIDDLTSTVNHALGLGFKQSGLSLSRFAINSTIGIFGLIDVASYMGLERDNLPMPVLLGRAGMDQGTYLIAPIGPTSLRDTHGWAVDRWPYYLITAPWITVVCSAVKAVHQRSKFIDQEELIDNAVDPYAQMRQIILMYDEGQVHPNAAAEDTKEQLDADLLDEIDG
ncbi:MAG: VacJ family lipoprotein [Succinivibrio sp.]|nr:VacJ family lipoprotein [Succinivibrio sp.]